MHHEKPARARRRRRRAPILPRCSPAVRRLIYEFDSTYRRLFSLTLLNMELLFDSLEVDCADFARLATREVRFEMDLASGVVWEAAAVGRK